MFKPGHEFFLASDSPANSFSAVFEDDSDSGYFYGCERARDGEIKIFGAVHIYNVASVADRDRDSQAEIFWTTDGLKALLTINGSAHAAFDFVTKRGYSRNELPAEAALLEQFNLP